ncbi:Pentatricopeptide repeat-containing protein [Nymphaea thermarum]|nr:Pentatricopeptide repeat-containing protein [Nymphaea thermarum]
MAGEASKFQRLLKRCQGIAELKQIHAHFILSPHPQPLNMATLIAQLYINCGVAYHEHAVGILRQVPNPSLYLYNVVMRGYSESRNPSKTIFFFKEMVGSALKPDNFTYPFVLKSCARLFALTEGIQIHGFVIKTGFDGDGFVHNTLMNMYAATGEVDRCEKLFNSSSFRDSVSWNTMMLSYAHSNRPLYAFELYKMMKCDKISAPNQITMVTLLGVCSQLRRLDLGKWVHGMIELQKIEYNLVLETALVNMYSKCGKVDIARQLFDKMSVRNVASWNAMISGYARNGQPNDGLILFDAMKDCGLVPNEITMLSVVSCCTQLRDIEMGNMVLDYMRRQNIVLHKNLQNALVDMYAKCKDMESAKKLFDEMKERDQISWASLIGGYVRSSRFDEAIQAFQQMQLSNAKPDAVTLINLLKLCSALAALDLGRWVHFYMDRNKISDLYLNTALIDMYCKCGNVADAIDVFNRMPTKNAMSWTAIISGLGLNGCNQQALKFFAEMQRESMVRPDEITFITVLSACSHAGLVEQGYHYFHLMRESYGIEPTVEHYGCMVDLLGRAGLVQEAQKMVQKMPMKPSASVLGSLLNSCKIHGQFKIAEEVAKYIQETGSVVGATYVTCSNIYADAMLWEDVYRVRKDMQISGVERIPGGSLIALDSGVQEFLCGR